MRLKKEALRREFCPRESRGSHAEEKKGLEQELLGGKEHT